MNCRWFSVVATVAVLPFLSGADWLITTHSGSDVLLYDDQQRSLSVLVTPGEGGLDKARGVTFGPEEDLFVCSAGARNWAVIRYDRGGRFQGVFAAGEGLAHPYQCLFGPDGDLYVSGQDNNAVLRYDGKSGKSKGEFVQPGSGGLDAIRGIVFHPDGDLLVAGRDNDAVLRFDGKSGQFLGFFIGAKVGKLHRPIQLHYGPEGHLYVGSSHNNRILRFHGRTGKFIDQFVKHNAGGLDHPAGFAWGPDGDLYIASRKSNQILRFDGKRGTFKETVLSRRQDERIHRPEFLLLRVR